jgi:hypothetical protein
LSVLLFLLEQRPTTVAKYCTVGVGVVDTTEEEEEVDVVMERGLHAQRMAPGRLATCWTVAVVVVVVVR